MLQRLQLHSHLTRVRLLQRRVALGVRHASARASSSASPTRLQYLSLYNYTSIDEQELPKLRKRMKQSWSELQVMGRIYIAQEGINAQLILPQAHVDAFADSFPGLFSREKLNFGAVYEGNDAHERGRLLFEKLDIRIRKQIVADGFEKGHLDLQDSGNALPPDQWHAKLQQRNASLYQSQEPQTNTGAGAGDDTEAAAAAASNTLVLDVRNFYEHEIGRFDGATRIMVDTFRDTFDAVDEILHNHAQQHDGQPPQEVMMYCTGGIRCEKVGAYLKQHKGIHAIHKLQGGIVNYQRFLEQQPQTPSLFKGKNFVFDQRCVGDEELVKAEVVTEDVLGACFQCGEPCNDHTNCSNLMCHGLILQCSSCATQYHGACSAACSEEVLKMAKMSTEEQRLYRKENAELWKPQNPNTSSAAGVKYVKFRPLPPVMKQNAVRS